MLRKYLYFRSPTPEGKRTPEVEPLHAPRVVLQGVMYREEGAVTSHEDVQQSVLGGWDTYQPDEDPYRKLFYQKFAPVDMSIYEKADSLEEEVKQAVRVETCTAHAPRMTSSDLGLSVYPEFELGRIEADPDRKLETLDQALMMITKHFREYTQLHCSKAFLRLFSEFQTDETINDNQLEVIAHVFRNMKKPAYEPLLMFLRQICHVPKNAMRVAGHRYIFDMITSLAVSRTTCQLQALLVAETVFSHPRMIELRLIDEIVVEGLKQVVWSPLSEAAAEKTAACRVLWNVARHPLTVQYLASDIFFFLNEIRSVSNTDLKKDLLDILRLVCMAVEKLDDKLIENLIIPSMALNLKKGPCEVQDSVLHLLEFLCRDRKFLHYLLQASISVVDALMLFVRSKCSNVKERAAHFMARITNVSRANSAYLLMDRLLTFRQQQLTMVGWMKMVKRCVRPKRGISMVEQVKWFAFGSFLDLLKMTLVHEARIQTAKWEIPGKSVPALQVVTCPNVNFHWQLAEYLTGVINTLTNVCRWPLTPSTIPPACATDRSGILDANRPELTNLTMLNEYVAFLVWQHTGKEVCAMLRAFADQMQIKIVCTECLLRRQTQSTNALLASASAVCLTPQLRGLDRGERSLVVAILRYILTICLLSCKTIAPPHSMSKTKTRTKQKVPASSVRVVQRINMELDAKREQEMRHKRVALRKDLIRENVFACIQSFLHVGESQIQEVVYLVLRCGLNSLCPPIENLDSISYLISMFAGSDMSSVSRSSKSGLGTSHQPASSWSHSTSESMKEYLVPAVNEVVLGMDNRLVVGLQSKDPNLIRSCVMMLYDFSRAAEPQHFGQLAATGVTQVLIELLDSRLATGLIEEVAVLLCKLMAVSDGRIRATLELLGGAKVIMEMVAMARRCLEEQTDSSSESSTIDPVYCENCISSSAWLALKVSSASEKQWGMIHQGLKLLANWKQVKKMQQVFIVQAERAYLWAHPDKREDAELRGRLYHLINSEDTDEDVDTLIMSDSEPGSQKSDSKSKSKTGYNYDPTELYRMTSGHDSQRNTFAATATTKLRAPKARKKKDTE